MNFYDLYETHGEDSGKEYAISTVHTAQQCDDLSESLGMLVVRVLDSSKLGAVALWLADSHRRGALVYVSKEEASEALSVCISAGAKRLDYCGSSIKIRGARRSELETAALSLLSVSECGDIPKQAYRTAAAISAEVPVEMSLEEAAAKLSSACSSISEERAAEMIGYFCELDAKGIDAITSITSRDGVRTEKIEFNSDLCVDILKDHGPIYLAVGSTGSGKTKLGEMLSDSVTDYGGGVVVTGPRRAILRSSFKSLPYYEDAAKVIDGARGLTSMRICAPSINSELYRSIVDSAELLVIDEISQTLRDLYAGISKSGEEAVSRLRRAIKTTRVVYCADADAGDFVVDFLRSSGREVVVLDDKKRSESLSGVSASFMSSEAGWSEILCGHLAGESLYIATDSKREAKRIEKKLRSEKRADGTSATILLITADTILDADVQRFLERPDECTSTHVVASPAAQSGLSITSDRFTRVHAVLRGMVSHTDCVQMMRRVRSCKSISVSVDIKSTMVAGADDRINSLSSVVGSFSTFDKIAQAVISEQSFSASKQAAGVWRLLESQGVKCIRAESSEDKKADGRSIRASATQLESAEHLAALLAAHPLTPESARSLRLAGEDRASVDAISEERYQLEKTWGLSTVEIKETHARLWRRGALAKQKAAWKSFFMTDETASFIDKKEAAEGVPVTARSFAVQRSAFCKLVISSLGIQADSDGVRGSFDAEDAMRLISASGDHIGFIRSIGDTIKISPKDCAKAKEGSGAWTRRASAILEELFGVKTVAAVVRDKSGKQSRTSVVCQERIAEIYPMLLSSGLK